MLTARGWWLLVWPGAMAAVALPWLAFWSPTMAVLALSVLSWFLAEWVLFLVRSRAAMGHLTVERHIHQGDRELPNLWAGLDGVIRVRVRLRSRFRLPVLALADKLPVGLTVAGGSRKAVCTLDPDGTVELEYAVHPTLPGIARFEGLEVRVSDLCGFFYRRWFLRLPTEYLILPPLTDDEGGQRATKRFNSLPPPGVHRLHRPGSGSELLELRDYRPGDPPKTIAWKISARRDRLITKEFENDVPVRCVLFLDASETTRVGEPGDTPLGRLAAIGSGVAQAASATRDLVGLTVFDETAAHTTRPARTRAHTMHLLRTFAETAGRAPPRPPTADAQQLLDHAYPLAQELYPDLLDRKINTRPFWMFWIPLLDSRLGWLVLLLLLSPLLIFKREVTQWVAETGLEWGPRRAQYKGVFALLYLPVFVGTWYWFIYGIRGIFPPRSRRLSQRKQLGALFAALNDDEPAAVGRAMHDDAYFAARAAAFLAEHRVSPPAPLLDENGDSRYLAAPKVAVLADALVRTIGTARDNELYVLLIDVAELAGQLEPLVKAVRAAVGRHHQVLVLLPWPADLPPPADPRAPAAELSRKPPSLGHILEGYLADRYQERFQAARLELVRAGATVVRIEQTDPVRLVLARIDRIRVGGVKR